MCGHWWMVGIPDEIKKSRKTQICPAGRAPVANMGITNGFQSIPMNSNEFQSLLGKIVRGHCEQRPKIF